MEETLVLIAVEPRMYGEIVHRAINEDLQLADAAEAVLVRTVRREELQELVEDSVKTKSSRSCVIFGNDLSGSLREAATASVSFGFGSEVGSEFGSEIGSAVKVEVGINSASGMPLRSMELEDPALEDLLCVVREVALGNRTLRSPSSGLPTLLGEEAG